MLFLFRCDRNVSRQFWYRLMVTTEAEILHGEECDENNSCTLDCPEEKVQFPNVTRDGIVWQKVLVHTVELLAA